MVKINEKQKQVLCMIADGLKVDQIAEKMKVSPRTVEMHSLVLREKFGANNTPHLIAIAFRQNIIQ